MDKARTIISAAARVVVVIAVLGFTDAMAFSPGDARNVVDRVVDLISNNYVVPEERAAIVAALRANEAAGRYDVSEAGALVDRLSPDLAAAGNDKHLWITFDPAQNAALRKPAEHGNAGNFSTLQGRAHNQGYEAFRVLPGNVRYLNLTEFHWNGSVTAKTVGDSARFLSGGDAVIIDLRENGGGSGAAVQALISYFLPPDRRKLMTFREGAKGPGTSSYVLGELRGPRMVGKPLYVLVSSATGSAAEEFAYHVAMFKLGTLVGSTTAGAANNDTLYPVGEDFVLSVSTGRPEHPVSHANWQGVGVSPDVNVPPDKALEAAHLLALKQLSTRAGTDPARYAWIVAGLEGKLAPPQVDADTMRAYAGIYGVRKISVANGSLVFQRGTGAPTLLSPIAPDLFALASTERVRLRFRRSATGIAGFDLIDENGAIIPVDRTS